MNETGDQIENHEGRKEKFVTKDRRQTSTRRKEKVVGSILEPEVKPKMKVSKSSGKKMAMVRSETYRAVQTVLLASSILLLSYHGLRYGRTEYSVLESGQIVKGFVSTRRAVITFSLGYSALYSFLSSVSALMLLYSLASKKPRWSLPTIFIYMADLVCHVADSLVAFRLFFGHLKFSTALLYMASTACVISGELWMWLGALRLYEQRAFKGA